MLQCCTWVLQVYKLRSTTNGNTSARDDSSIERLVVLLTEKQPTQCTPSHTSGMVGWPEPFHRKFVTFNVNFIIFSCRIHHLNQNMHHFKWKIHTFPLLLHPRPATTTSSLAQPPPLWKSSCDKEWCLSSQRWTNRFIPPVNSPVNRTDLSEFIYNLSKTLPYEGKEGSLCKQMMQSCI